MSFSVENDDIRPQQTTARPQRRDEERRPSREQSDLRDTVFNNIQSNLGRDFAGGNVDQRTGLVRKWLEEVLANINTRFKDGELVQVLINKEEDFVRYPGVVVGLKFNDGQEKIIGHTWLIENPDDPLELLEPIRVAGQQVDIQPVPALVYDNDYANSIQKRVRANFNNQELVFIDAGVTPIHKYFDLSQPADLLALLYTTIASLSAFRGYEIGDYTKMMSPEQKSKYSSIVARVDMGAAVEYDELDLPQRSDWSIVLTETPPQARGEDNAVRSYNARAAAPTTFAEVNGFTNVLYTAPDEEARKPRNFIAEFRITSINAPKIIPSLESFLFAIGSTAILNSDSLWVDGFTPRNTQHSPRRDIGALELELPLEGENIGRKHVFVPSERNEDYYDFMDFVFSDRVVHSLECPLAGPTAWLTDNFVQAADEYEGIKDVAGFIDRIIDSANRLTNNEFSEFFNDRDNQIVENNYYRTHNGFYIDESQRRRDIRDVDYLYLLNDENPVDALRLAEEWDRSVSPSTPMVIGERDRYNILQDVKGGDGFALTGYSRVVSFTPQFMVALVKAMFAAGLGVTQANTQRHSRGAQRRRIDTVYSAGLSSDLGKQFSRNDRVDRRAGFSTTNRFRSNY